MDCVFPRISVPNGTHWQELIAGQGLSTPHEAGLGLGYMVSLI